MKTKDRDVAQALLPVLASEQALGTGKSACATTKMARTNRECH